MIGVSNFIVWYPPYLNRWVLVAFNVPFSIEVWPQPGDYGAKYTISAADSNNAKLAGLKTGVFKVKVTLAKVAAEYIEFKGTFIAGLDTATAIQTDTATGDVYFELIKDFSFGHADTTLSFDFDISTTDYTNAAFKYKAGKKPQGKAAHTTLQTALNEKTEILKFDYTFEAKAE